ncbi:maltase-glucoamylase, intestinal, partial [Trichonephila clavipes]
AALLPTPGITFRTIGGIIDLFFFVGTDPESVVKLYTSLVGRTQMPPYWALGFQLSRYGYNSLDNLKTALERTRKADIAQDVQFLDIDHMEGKRDFNFDKKEFCWLSRVYKQDSGRIWNEMDYYTSVAELGQRIRISNALWTKPSSYTPPFDPH